MSLASGSLILRPWRLPPSSLRQCKTTPTKLIFSSSREEKSVGDSIDRFSAASHFSPKQFSPWPPAAWWLRHNLSTGDSDRPLFRAESMISLQRILSGRARGIMETFSPSRDASSHPIHCGSYRLQSESSPLPSSLCGLRRLPARHSIYQSIMNSVISRVSASQSA